jgi:hypothetical protein
VVCCHVGYKALEQLIKAIRLIDDAMGFCESVDLMPPNIPACAPARNKN